MRQKLLLICLLMILVLCGFSQDLIVNGTIKDETNRPVEGATVTIKGTSTGAMRDALGKFTIKAQNGVFLVITHVAYEKAEQAVTSDQFDIVLKSNASKMDEVVVVGYGQQSKKSLTTSISKVSSELNIAKLNSNIC